MYGFSYLSESVYTLHLGRDPREEYLGTDVQPSGKRRCGEAQKFIILAKLNF